MDFNIEEQHLGGRGTPNEIVFQITFINKMFRQRLIIWERRYRDSFTGLKVLLNSKGLVNVMVYGALFVELDWSRMCL